MKNLILNIVILLIGCTKPVTVTPTYPVIPFGTWKVTSLTSTSIEYWNISDQGTFSKQSGIIYKYYFDTGKQTIRFEGPQQWGWPNISDWQDITLINSDEWITSKTSYPSSGNSITTYLLHFNRLK